MNGPRMTVNRCFSVGSGTGPETSAPVRWAVSTICLADWSRILWSNAFNRMRMRCFGTFSVSSNEPIKQDGGESYALRLRCIVWGGYSWTLVTTPAPTVRPPSRMAKRNPSSSATGLISSMPSSTLSPGITISTPSGNATDPVTSVVRM